MVRGENKYRFTGSGEKRKDQCWKTRDKEVWERRMCVDPQEWIQNVKIFAPRIGVHQKAFITEKGLSNQTKSDSARPAVSFRYPPPQFWHNRLMNGEVREGGIEASVH